MADQWWSWALSIIGATTFYLAGKKIWWTWYLGLFTQLLWLGYTLVTQQWGFLVGVALYTFVYSKNARDWTRDHFRPKPKKITLLKEDALASHLTTERVKEIDGMTFGTYVSYVDLNEKAAYQMLKGYSPTLTSYEFLQQIMIRRGHVVEFMGEA